MANIVASFAASRGIYRDAPRVRSRFKLDWWPLVRPDGYWPIPHSLDEVFQALAWMLEMSQPWDARGYTPAGLLLNGGGAVNVSVASSWPHEWPTTKPVEEARRRIARALCGTNYASQGVIDWRERLGVTFDRKAGALTMRPALVTRPAYAHDAGPLSVHESGERLARLLTCAGRERLVESHNRYHPKATTAHAVRMYLTAPIPSMADGASHEEAHAAWKRLRAEEIRRRRFFLVWRFEVEYGYPDAHSSWGVHLATQKQEETWLDAMLRAEACLSELAGPAEEAPRV